MHHDIADYKNYLIIIVCAWLIFEAYHMVLGAAMEGVPNYQINKKNSSKKKFVNNNIVVNTNNNNNNNTNSKRKESTTKINLNRKLAGSNWQNISGSILPSAPPAPVVTLSSSSSSVPATTTTTTTKDNANCVQKLPAPRKKPKHSKKITKYLAMDCEMVGIGSNGQNDMLARVSIVNQNGDVLLDKYVKPQENVIDYRTKWSGIRPKDIENGEEFSRVQEEVLKLLQDKILVGHSISNDLAVLFIKHPYKYIRDTAKYKPLAKLVANGATPSLKRLSKVILGLDIQSGEHDSVEDARAAMLIYNRFNTDWENYLKKKYHHHHRGARTNRSGRNS